MDQSEQPAWELPDSEKSFADIMREAAGGRRAGLNVPLPPMHSPPESDNRHIADLLQVVEPAKRGALVFPVIQAFGSLGIVVLATGFITLLTSWNWLVPAALALLTMLIANWRIERALWYLASTSKQRIEGSAILEKLLLDPRELESIYDWTPWPWSLVFLGPRPRNLKGWVRIVAVNIDWYTGEPHRLFRFWWVMTVAYLFTSIAFLCLSVYGLHASRSLIAASPELVATCSLTFALVPYFYLLATAYNGRKAIIGLKALSAYLRERFADGDNVSEEQA